MKFEITDDVCDKILVKSLKRTRNYLERGLSVKDPMIFFSDPKKDKKEIRKYIKAIDLVISYYSVQE